MCFLVRTGSTLGTCLNRDGTLQPQVCMMPSSRRTCSRTCRYCSRRCSRRANIAESLRRDATPLLASLEEAGGREGKRRKKRSVSSLASQQQETKRREMKKRRQVKASAITTAKQSSKMTKSNVQFSVLRHKRRKLEASVSVWLGGWCFCGFCVFTRQTFVVKKLRLRGNKRGPSGHKRASSELFSRQVWGFRVTRDVGKFSRRSLFREELQGTVGGGDLTHGVAASLRETGRWGRFVMDVDVAERPLDGRRAGWWAEETCEARRWTEREICLGYFFFFYITIESWLKAESHNCQMVDFFFSWMGGFSRDALRGKERWN